MKTDTALNPLSVRFFHTDTVMTRPQPVAHQIHQPAWFGDKILHKHLRVFCNISAWLSRYLGDIHADTAHYSKKINLHPACQDNT